MNAATSASRPVPSAVTSIRLSKEYFHFCTAHFLIFADGRRERLHGHNYRVAAEIQAPVGPGSLVLDFMRVKPILKALCDELDHCTILPRDNPWVDIHSESTPAGAVVTVTHGTDRFVFPQDDVLVVPITNTSTECFAEYLCDRFVAALLAEFPTVALREIEIVVEESGGQAAAYRRRLSPPTREAPA